MNIQKLTTEGGKIEMPDETIFRDDYSHGVRILDIKKALELSSNIFFYHISGGFEDFKGMGHEKLTRYYKKYGLGQTLGLDMNGEVPGLIPDKDWKKKVKNEPWYTGDTFNISIGQGDILITPLQVASYTGMIANRGTLYKPRLVKSIKKSKQEIIPLKPEINKTNLASEKNIQIVQEGMKRVVSGNKGTAKDLNNLPLGIHAKTGTAESAGGEETAPHSWTTSYANINGKNLVVTVMVEHGGYSHDTALPITKQVYEWLLNNL